MMIAESYSWRQEEIIVNLHIQIKISDVLSSALYLLRSEEDFFISFSTKRIQDGELAFSVRSV